MLNRLCLPFLLGLSLSASAFSQSREERPQNQVYLENSELNLNPAKLTLGIGLIGVQYFSESSADTNFQQQMEARFSYNISRKFLFKIDGFVGTFSLPKSSYFSIPELYTGVTLAENNLQFSVGRKLENFSFLDKEQNLALFNSHFTNDFIHTQEQGLVGIHANMHGHGGGIYAGYYPIYLFS